jgi:tRNA(Ile)-lysidine synthase
MRKDPAVRAILLSWRRLTASTSPPRKRRESNPNRGTLIACSGGADSCALVLALAAAGNGPNTGRLVVAHIIHDLRPEHEALADRNAARALAESLNLDFAEARIRVRDKGGNLEATAREARYAALAEMALERNLPYIATAHHADDQLETILMSLLRGTGASGIRGMRAKRRIGNRESELGIRDSAHPIPASRLPTPALTLIRPMLTEHAIVDREACRRICRLANVQWREDATNTDTSRLRAAVRHRIAPVLRELRPDIGRRAIAAASFAEASERRLLRAATRLLHAGRTDAQPHSFLWPRAKLRKADALVLGAMLRLARKELCGPGGDDRTPKRVIDAAVRALRDEIDEPRTIAVGAMRLSIASRAAAASKARAPR